VSILTKIMRPESQGTFNNWALGGAAATAVAAVDPLDPIAHDDDTGRLQIGAGVAETAHSMVLGPVSKPSASTVVSVSDVRIGIRARLTAGGPEPLHHTIIRAGSTGSVLSPDITTSYTTHLNAFARPGGGNWEPADIAGDLEVLWSQDDFGGAVRVTSAWGEVDYENDTGATVLLVWQLLGPLVAVGFQELPRLRDFLWRRAGVWVHDLADLQAELRAPRRVYGV
jgi:hypothetical protein